MVLLLFFVCFAFIHLDFLLLLTACALAHECKSEEVKAQSQKQKPSASSTGITAHAYQRKPRYLNTNRTTMQTPHLQRWKFRCGCECSTVSSTSNRKAEFELWFSAAKTTKKHGITWSQQSFICIYTHKRVNALTSTHTPEPGTSASLSQHLQSEFL